MSFENLGLTQALLKAISKKGYTSPSSIQEKAIPPILEGRDILASAQTGTGKTAGFTLPLLQILSKGNVQRQREVRALVLTPTRELAAQVFENVKEYGEFLDLKAAVIFGGVSQLSQVRQIRQGVDILVATPGRLLDLYNQKLLSLSKVEIFVLDEADRMLDMGFIKDIQKVLQVMPLKRQNLMFSATFSAEIRSLANSILDRPIKVDAAVQNSTVDAISQKVYHVSKALKTDLIIKLISEGKWSQVLVFTRTKHGANRLCEKMSKAGITASAIHGNKSQGARTSALSGFKSGSIRVLVATDIAARGIDIPLLPHVINFEIPNVPEDYVHRIGRTGRAGANGEAISLVSTDESNYLRDIERLVGAKIPSEIMAGFEPNPSDADEPTGQQRRNIGRKPESRNKPQQGSPNRSSTSNSNRFRSVSGRSKSEKRNQQTKG